MTFLLKSIIITLLFISTSGLSAQGTKFEEGSWSEIKAKAKEQNKSIFVDVSTVWCGPCKWMKKNTFKNQAVGDYMNANFISYLIDGEKGEGVAFIKEHNINAFPTLLYFNPNGELIHKVTGAKDSTQMIETCKAALNPDKQLVGLIKKYKSGTYDKKFLRDYSLFLVRIYEEASEPFQKYWASLSQTEKVSKDGLFMLWNASYRFSDFRSEMFVFFAKHKEEYILLDKNLVEEYWDAAYNNAIWTVADINNQKEQRLALLQLKKLFPNQKKSIKPHLDFTLAERGEDQALIKKTKKKYLAVCQSWSTLNGEAWNLYEKENASLKELEQALEWASRSTAIKEHFFNLDTKAAILFKLKRYKEAKAEAKKAIHLAKKDRYLDSSEMKKLIKKIDLATEEH